MHVVHWRKGIMQDSKMSLFLFVLLATVSLTLGQDDNTDKYPDRWNQIDVTAAIDNERLFNKYKTCFITNNTSGCTKDGLEIKKNIPDILATLCDKCTPAHIETGRVAISYTCKTRRKDYDEIKAVLDPDGSILRRAEEKYGKLSCE